MMHAFCSFIDMEGVLAPEMWPQLAADFGIVDLKTTTREIADYRLLMRRRLAALIRDNITIEDIRASVAVLEPFEGALNFIQGLKRLGRVVIVSDSFRPMNEHFLSLLPIDSVLCHDFQTDEGGRIEGCHFWNDLVGKHLCFQVPGLESHRTFAMGDALNDLTMLRAASRGVLFRASPTTRSAAPDLEVISTYSEALERAKSAAYGDDLEN